MKEVIVARTSTLVEGSGKKCLHSEYILKVEQVEFADSLNVGMREGLRVTSLTRKVFGPSRWGGWIGHLLRWLRL